MANRAREILNSVDLWESLDGQSFEFILGLLRHHPLASEKIGSGVVRIEVRPACKGTRCFYAVRDDGTDTDFSIKTCLTHRTPFQDFRNACRSAVQDQIQQFKQTAFAGREAIPCAVSGQLVTWNTCHVDHEKPSFDALAQEFAVGRNLITEVAPTEDGATETRFKEQATEEAFQLFHQARAKLRVVSKVVNLSYLRRQQS